jgi:cardiolipin synthase
LTFFFEGDDFFWSLREALSAARSSVDVVLYYFGSDRIGWSFAHFFAKKRGEGVKIRIFYDAVGCRSTSSELFEELRRNGIEVKVYNPVFPPTKHFGRRNHRKMIVIDGQVGFLGGFNLADEYSRWAFGEKAWRDSGVRVEAPEIVRTLQQIFEEEWEGRKPSLRTFVRRKIPRPNWDESACFAVPNHGWRRKSLIRQEYLSAIARATRSIYITNPYFIPDRGIRSALKRAARRGVDVRILTAGETDVRVAKWAGRATYTSFLRAGGRIFEYQSRVLHAKTAVIDEDWWTVGTSNIDHLSFFQNLEVNLFGRNRSSAKSLSDQFEKDLLESREIKLEEWKKRSWFAKAREKFFFFFREWL